MTRSLNLLLVLVLVLSVLVPLACASGSSKGKQNPKRRPRRSTANGSLSPKTRREVKRLERELEALREKRCNKLLPPIEERLDAARRCMYNGLSFPDYRRVRAICKNRSESLDALRECRRVKCSEEAWLLKARMTAVAACEQIGWDGQKHCPSVRAIKADLELKRKVCRDGGKRVREIKTLIEVVLGNQANPSVSARQIQ